MRERKWVITLRFFVHFGGEEEGFWGVYLSLFGGAGWADLEEAFYAFNVYIHAAYYHSIVRDLWWHITDLWAVRVIVCDIDWAWHMTWTVSYAWKATWRVYIWGIFSCVLRQDFGVGRWPMQWLCIHLWVCIDVLTWTYEQRYLGRPLCLIIRSSMSRWTYGQQPLDSGWAYMSIEAGGWGWVLVQLVIGLLMMWVAGWWDKLIEDSWQMHCWGRWAEDSDWAAYWWSVWADDVAVV